MRIAKLFVFALALGLLGSTLSACSSCCPNPCEPNPCDKPNPCEKPNPCNPCG
jgi:hypothetical protein